LSPELKRYANVLAKWAEHLPLKHIYIFGSRVRGDATDSSDLDIALVFAPPSTVDERIWNWNQQNATDFRALREELGVVISLHTEKNDAAWPDILAGAAEPVFSVGIVSCVITPRRKP
jgi:predicted nucleotidyltransferase